MQINIVSITIKNRAITANKMRISRVYNMILQTVIPLHGVSTIVSDYSRPVILEGVSEGQG